ncbi:MAG: hypothetical protein IKF01_01140 [Bacilli bacterium]|nr:hypothetical protein [Bacilli bacterium]
MKKVEELNNDELYDFLKSLDEKEKKIFMKYYLENSKNMEFSMRLMETDNLLKKNREELEGKKYN